jgi:hypothetical protein
MRREQASPVERRLAWPAGEVGLTALGWQAHTPGDGGAAGAKQEEENCFDRIHGAGSEEILRCERIWAAARPSPGCLPLR